ncbi:MAG: hypothetical protein LIO53_08765 [Oscillospiraceae bacterium]|nr:hypothetical protein [Oscillospiraceae bacterium]
MVKEIDTSVKELILQYFKAFSNLYAIISMKRALKIIKKQNPQLSLTDEEFINFVENYKVLKEDHFIIVYDEEMYDENPPEEKDTLKKFLISEFLYSVDEDAYDEMKDTQGGFRFYVPEREELLKYADEFYYEKNIYQQRMKDFLKDEIKLNEHIAEEVVYDCVFAFQSSTFNCANISFVIDDMQRMSGNKFKDFKNTEQAEKFSRLYYDIINHTRVPMFRGLTPIEANEKF